MSNKLLDFKTKILNNESGDEVVTFYLSCDCRSGMFYNASGINKKLIELDQDDLDYFKNKYFPKLEDEYQTNLAELNKKYNK